MTANTVQVDEIPISHPERIVYPDDGITKEDVARYYSTVSKWLLPYIENRPVTMFRCPGGSGKKAICFFQKHPQKTIPRSIERITVPEGDGVGEYIKVRSEQDLVWLAQMNVLEIHVWGARLPDVTRPDRMIFDLDPGEGVTPKEVIERAHTLRAALSAIGLESFPRVTGGKGVHVVVPLSGKPTWEAVHDFSRGVAFAMEESDPDRITATSNKLKRKGRIYVDYLRNTQGATAVTNYSLRARPGAPIAVPVTWEELTPRLKLNGFTIKNIARRLKAGFRDPWKGIEGVRQKLPRG